jgi:HK97 family phage portal protein
MRGDRAALPVTDVATVLSQSYMSKDVETVGTSFLSFATDGYQGNGVVFSCVQARTSLFAQATFKWQNLATQRLFGDGSLSLLENPWPNGTTTDLLARMLQDVDLAGNAFVRIWPDRLERLRPDHVDIVHVDAAARGREEGPDEVIGYIYWCDGRGGDGEFVPVEEVVHWSPIPDPTTEFRGMSWLTPVVREINADMAMTEHKSQFFGNAATPNLVIKYERKLGQDQINRLRERWQARYGGPENGWRTAILDEGADLTVVGNTFEQMDFTTLQAAGERRVCLAAGVPPTLFATDQTYANFGQAWRSLADGTVYLLWVSAVAALSKAVPAPAGARLWFDTSAIPVLQEAETARAEAARTWAVAAGELIRAGYDPQTVANALIAGDMSLLTHTGAIPTALYPDGKAPGPGGTA